MRVSVVVPALNEEATVGQVIASLDQGAAHEIIVIDADSTDETAREAAAAGAVVYNWREILPAVETVPGKGESLWRGVAAATGDVVVFVDADLTHVPPDLIARLSQPFRDDNIHMVKAEYRRSFEGAPTGGGRVTELSAKPLLKLYFPELAPITQPLGGEYAIRRSTALTLPFVSGYGVEAGLLIDVYRSFGRQALAQVDLGHREHRNRPLAELAPMAEIVSATILGRAGALPEGSEPPTERPPLSAIV